MHTLQNNAIFFHGININISSTCHFFFLSCGTQQQFWDQTSSRRHPAPFAPKCLRKASRCHFFFFSLPDWTKFISVKTALSGQIWAFFPPTSKWAKAPFPDVVEWLLWPIRIQLQRSADRKPLFPSTAVAVLEFYMSRIYSIRYGFLSFQLYFFWTVNWGVYSAEKIKGEKKSSINWSVSDQPASLSLILIRWQQSTLHLFTTKP